MKKLHMAAIALAVIAFISGAFLSVMAVSAERGIRGLDMDWWD